MNSTGLEKAVEILGGVSALARSIQCHPTIISKWRDRGIPAERVIGICVATRGRVTPHELRPDIYPDPNWLPDIAEDRAA